MILPFPLTLDAKLRLYAIGRVKADIFNDMDRLDICLREFPYSMSYPVFIYD